MTDSNKLFEKYILALIVDLNKYQSCEGTVNFINNFDKLDINKLTIRYYGAMNKYKTDIRDRNSCIFDNQLLLFPDIDISHYWNIVNEKRKIKIWIYLQLLNTINDIEPQKPEDEFNPYIGIGSNTNLGVSDIVTTLNSANTSAENKSNDFTADALGSIMGMFGLKGNTGLGEINDHIKNISSNDLDNVTDNIKNMFVGTDKNTSEFISGILTNITDEIKHNNTKQNNNPFENLKNIAESVISKTQNLPPGVNLNSLLADTVGTIMSNIKKQ